MSASKSLQRLLRIREIEEEQRRMKLESALAAREKLDRAREAAARMEEQGRAGVRSSVLSGAVADRQAGLVQSLAAHQRARALVPRIAAADREALERRREFLEKRIERHQAETLIEQAEASEERESGRRSQRGVDDWFGARRHRQASQEKP